MRVVVGRFDATMPDPLQHNIVRNGAFPQVSDSGMTKGMEARPRWLRNAERGD